MQIESSIKDLLWEQFRNQFENLLWSQFRRKIWGKTKRPFLYGQFKCRLGAQLKEQDYEQQ